MTHWPSVSSWPHSAGAVSQKKPTEHDGPAAPPHVWPCPAWANAWDAVVRAQTVAVKPRERALKRMGKPPGHVTPHNARRCELVRRYVRSDRFDGGNRP